MKDEEDTEDKLPLLHSSEITDHKSDEHSTSRQSSHSTSSHIETYKRRWFMLAIFCLNTFVNGCLFSGLSPITNIASDYYQQSPVVIEWLSNSFLLFYCIFGIPAAFAVTRYGIRPLLTLASMFDAVGAIFHYFGYESDRFWCVIVGQAFAAIAYAMIIHLPGQLSAKWFPEDERATATSIGVFMNIAGVAMRFLQTTQMVSKHSTYEETKRGIQNIFVTQLIFIVIVFVLTVLAYREKPPSPPTNILTHESDNKVNFKEDVVILFRDRNFIFLSQAYGIYFGLFVTVMVLINDLVTTVYKTGYETNIGWMAFTGLVTSIVSMFLLGLWLDKHPLHRMIAILLNTASAVTWLIFILVLTGTDNFIALFITYGVLGAVSIPFFSTGIEQAAEMSYPIPEIISSTLILMFGNMYGFIMILLLGMLSERGHIHIVSYTMFILYLISTIFAYFAKTELKRGKAEETASREIEMNESSSY